MSDDEVEDNEDIARIITPSPRKERPSHIEWNYIQKIYHRSSHPEWKNWDQKTRAKKAKDFWEELKEDALWRETFIQFQDEHAIHLDQMDFWKKDIRRLTIQRQKRKLEETADDQENGSPNVTKKKSPPKKKRKVTKRVKPKPKPKEPEPQMQLSGIIKLKGDGYEVGDFGLLLTEALSTEMSIDCEANTVLIEWYAWPCTSKKKLRMEMDISNINCVHLGAYQKWAHSKQESAYIDITMTNGKTPKFLERSYVRGQTETEMKFEETKDFTRGSALRNNKHRFKVRCQATNAKMQNLYHNLLASKKFEKVTLDPRFQ